MFKIYDKPSVLKSNPNHEAPNPAPQLRGITKEGANFQIQSFLDNFNKDNHSCHPNFLEKHSPHTSKSDGELKNRPNQFNNVETSTVFNKKSISELSKSFKTYMTDKFPQATDEWQPKTSNNEGGMHLVSWTPPAGTIQAVQHEKYAGTNSKDIKTSASYLNEAIFGVNEGGQIYHLHQVA